MRSLAFSLAFSLADSDDSTGITNDRLSVITGVWRSLRRSSMERCDQKAADAPASGANA